MAPLQRYTITVSPPGAESFQLLVPFTTTSTVASLASEVKRRASSHDEWPENSEIILRIGGATGPILYEFDILSDVIVDPKFDILTATPRIKKQPVGHAASDEQHQNGQQTDGPSFAGAIKIRVITPSLARSYRDSRSIPILRGSLTRNTTLRELKAHISNHLSYPVSAPVEASPECNCSLARQISERGLLTQLRPRDGGHSLSEPIGKLIVVHGRNRVQVLDTDHVDKSYLVSEVVMGLGGAIESREITPIGGTLLSSQSETYTKLPVMSVCSKQRHGEFQPVAASHSRGRHPNLAMNGLDIHTSESPIELSTVNMNLSLEELCLTECAIDGVLDIYVVERRFAAREGLETETGKDAIFLESDAWRHPVVQSTRGVAMLLSSLRIFTERISARHMELPNQDAVLHVVNILTRFPPAVRAVQILMSGKSPRSSERAALSQALYEVLKEVVPMQLIKSDPGRYFEGTRLLLGLILDKAKQLKLQASDLMPYISSMSVLDLRNTFTMESIIHPIQTSFGLVEEGYYDAFKLGGPLYLKTGEDPMTSIFLDQRTKRIALLSGGSVSQITVFDLNSLNSISGYASKGGMNLVIPARELCDLSYLSTLCSRHNMSVLPPAALASADSPALTLDRTGALSVYTGRAACAQPGKDISIFRPTSGGEETIDVSIVTQLLVPILAIREADGTAIFDAFGDSIRRKFKEPDEIIMVCVDCSSSMSEDSDFTEIKDDTDDTDGTDEEPNEFDTSDSSEDEVAPAGPANGTTFLRSTIDEMKTLITEHESFEDMIGIVRDASVVHRRHIASKVLGILSGLTSQELTHRLKQLDESKRRMPFYRYRGVEAAGQSDISRLKSLIAGLSTHKHAICDFLIYRASNSTSLDQRFVWNYGDAIPKIPKKDKESVNTLSEEDLVIPHDFMCPISRDVMEDPVFTCDGFTFDRNAIERWFQVRDSSPLTGLILENTELRSNGELSIRIKHWIGGEDVIGAIGETGPATRSGTSSNGTITVRFFSRLGDFTRVVPKTMSVSDLYKVAFRGLKGRHPKFQMHCKNVFLAPSNSNLSSANILNNSIIHINAPEESSSANLSSTDEFEELCLIKIYQSVGQMLFSYWIPKKTTNTFASVIFKYWRFQAKNIGTLWYASKIVAWTGLSSSGDNHLSGNPQDNWNHLSQYLNSQHATGKLCEERIFGTDGPETTEDKDEDGNADLEMGDQRLPTPLVLKLWMGGQRSEKKGKNLSRLDVLKNMFEAFSNRLLAYGFNTHLGLISFQSSAAISQPITHAIENFRHKVNAIRAHGDTALWDALALANDQLTEYAKKFPNAKKRIICLSDGMDTKSTQKAETISMNLCESKVVVDSFCLGDEDNVDLRTISYLTGGYKFQPDSLAQAMAICEMEPVLNQLERPPIVVPRQAHSFGFDPFLRFAFARDRAVPEIVTSDIFPQRRIHPNISDTFVQLSSLSTKAQQGHGSVNTHSDANLRTSRILTEIRNIVANPHPHYDIYVSEANMSFWKIIMQGPPDSAYSSGTFSIYLDMEQDYPAFPPKCRFTTPIYHPNINRHGKVCHSILDRNWTSDTTNLQLINTIYSLLLVPEFSDPINAVVTLNYHWDEVAFQEEVKAHIKKHAVKTRAEYKSEILGR
ncbi:hypothetical protein BKA65DRAFT_51346 [Rhexocercosporidium sp. MPI-PUGE-AT-0058]|nr:hypothetical protein BKA65DRAFT_51346 [Rhexocercosporidium sp. MPI-PUGE-AT-0058]